MLCSDGMGESRWVWWTRLILTRNRKLKSSLMLSRKGVQYPENPDVGPGLVPVRPSRLTLPERPPYGTVREGLLAFVAPRTGLPRRSY